MNCEMARALLDAYVDGELTAEQERALMDHVNACEHCKQEFEAAVLLKDILKDMDDDVAVPLGHRLPGEGLSARKQRKRA